MPYISRPLVVNSVSYFVGYGLLSNSSPHPYRPIFIGIFSPYSLFGKIFSKYEVNPGIIYMRIESEHSIRYVSSLIFGTPSFYPSHKRSKILLGDCRIIEI